MSLGIVRQFEEILSRVAPYMAGTVEKARLRFGAEWEQQFTETLSRIFAHDMPALELAIKGYVRFSLEATKLQKRFERERVYAPKTYDEAAAEVYHNEDYMNSLYIPGILLSHYLWPHHYCQLQFFHEAFAPILQGATDKRFCDIGIGSGFYSRQMLMVSPDVRGAAFDISEPALRYAKTHLEKFGVADRWVSERRNIVDQPPAGSWPFLVSVEVLEHLDDPLGFLKCLRQMLQPDGRGFITAAITAPNADHIYLYNCWEEVRDQLQEAGFTVLSHQEDLAYSPRADEPVPRLAAFIVR